MGKVDRIVRRNKARAVGRGMEFLERVRMEAFERGFLVGRQYEKRLREEKGEETSVDSGNTGSAGASGGG
jgi:hypothetical protein